MAKTKYGHLIKSSELRRDIAHYTGESIVAHKGELGQDCSLGYHCISQPMSFDEPHAHDFAEMLCFIGGDPEHIYDLGAEIEITLGDEMEKHTITQTSVLVLPEGLMHCPIVFKRVDKPLVFLEVSLSRYFHPKDRPSGKKK